jgi:hypothetical protein
MNQAFEDFRGDYLKKEFGHGMAIYIIINMEESVFLLFTASAYSFGIFKFCNMLLRRV